jgi:hypothetical protein
MILEDQSMDNNQHEQQKIFAISLTETIVDGNLSKFIFQDTNLPFILFLENVVDKGGLPCS